VPAENMKAVLYFSTSTAIKIAVLLGLFDSISFLPLLHIRHTND